MELVNLGDAANSTRLTMTKPATSQIVSRIVYQNGAVSPTGFNWDTSTTATTALGATAWRDSLGIALSTNTTTHRAVFRVLDPTFPVR